VRKTSIGAAISLVASLALASSALAASAFTNGSFEDASTGFTPPSTGYQTLVMGTPNATAMAGWTVTAGNVDWTSNGYSTWQSQDGSHSVDMNGTGNGGGSAAGIISQEFETTANDTYTVQFWVSNNTACGPSTKSMTASAGGSSETVDVPDSFSVYQGGWFAAAPLSFVASSDSATVSFAADASNTGNCGVVVDNVSFTQTASSGAQCKQGGWQEMVDASYVPFTNQGRCVSSYAKAGAVPIGSGKTEQPGNTVGTNNTNTAQCKNGGWKSLVDADGQPFKNQGRCVSYVAKGGEVTTTS
jgi:choice-of-anchor C domain-containing protein